MLYTDLSNNKRKFKGTLDSKKLKLQTRVRKIVAVRNERTPSLIDLQAQSNCENLISLIETCRQHNQIEQCKRYVDEFEIHPHLILPDSI